MVSNRNPKNLQYVDLSSIKMEMKYAQQEVKENQKELNKSINAIGKPVELPNKSAKRFEEKFGKKKEKTAIKIVIASFVVLFLILLYFQPSMFFITSNEQTLLVNFSERDLTNLKVYSANNLLDFIFVLNTKPIFEKQTMYPKEQIEIDSNKTTVLLAFANRQLVAIGTIVIPEDLTQPTSINNSEVDNNTGLYKGLKGQISASDENGG